MQYPLGVCGMPCGLCPMHHGSGTTRCVGCSAEEGSFSVQCKTFRCCGERNLSSCAFCAEVPCERIEGMTEFKGFDTGKVWFRVLRGIREEGLEQWYPSYAERCRMLEEAIARYNDGRMKTYLCRLFLHGDLEMLRAIMREASAIDEEDAKARGKRLKAVVLGLSGHPAGYS